VPRTFSNGIRDVRTWLRNHGYAHVAGLIDEVEASWAQTGRRTRRNWWDILAGGTRGRPRRVGGISFPVLADAQKRQGLPVTGNAVPAPRRRGRAVPAGQARSTAARTRGAKPGSKSNAAFPAKAKVTATGRAARGDARPFLKWAGGKRQLLREIMARLPRSYGTFHEPFVGGGAVFFALRPPAAVLSDSNERLIRAYRGIKNDVEEVMALLRTYRNNRRFFLQMRRRPIDEGSDAEVAAWMIFLNKTGFNGLYRVNSKNLFNVPFGDNQNATLCDEPNLRACAAALAGADLRCEDFSRVLDRARPGDVVYFDPPYVPLSNTSFFTSYTTGGFGWEDQRRLRDVAFELHKKGVFVLLSNSSAPQVRALYGPPFTCFPVSANRMVNSVASKRGPVIELLIQ